MLAVYSFHFVVKSLHKLDPSVRTLMHEESFDAVRTFERMYII